MGDNEAAIGETRFERGQRILSQQPFSVLLGTELVRADEHGVELRIPLRAEFLQQHGFAHGGLLSYAADNALTFAGGMALGGRPVLTSEYKINYVRPAVGEAVIVRAQVVYAGRKQAVARCDVFTLRDGVETLVAVGQGTTVVVEQPASTT
jgi:uncharacterized protein (TIGR00369 family)